MLPGNKSSARAFSDRLDVDKLGGRNKQAKAIMKKMKANGLEPVFYNAPYPWVEPGEWVSQDGRGGVLIDQPDEPRQWWPEGLSIEQVPDVSNVPIPSNIPITTERTLSDLEAFIREEGITAILAHSQGGHVAGLLMLQLEQGGNNPIERVVLMSTYNSHSEEDTLETPALIYHCENDEVVPIACHPTTDLWTNGVYYLRETGRHHISGRTGDWSKFCEFLGSEMRCL